MNEYVFIKICDNVSNEIIRKNNGNSAEILAMLGVIITFVLKKMPKKDRNYNLNFMIDIMKNDILKTLIEFDDLEQKKKEKNAH